MLITHLKSGAVVLLVVCALASAIALPTAPAQVDRNKDRSMAGTAAAAVPGERSAVVLNDCDKNFDRVHRPHDGLHILHVVGKDERPDVKSVGRKEFNTCETIGGNHCVAIDWIRGRTYVVQLAANRLTALDVHGRTVWEVRDIEAGAVAVDEKTGRVWCTVGGSLVEGKTVVFDDLGRQVASYPATGVDIAYDPHTSAFWLVGKDVTKLSRDGAVLFRQACDGWAFVSVAASPNDGSIWIVERAHPDVAGSVNRIWHRDANGGTIKTWDMHENLIFGVASEPKTGAAWVTRLGGNILRFSGDGKAIAVVPVKARAVSVSPKNGRVWVTTETEILTFDGANHPHPVARFEEPSGQSWVVAF
jgi:hypothetical protein